MQRKSFYNGYGELIRHSRYMTVLPATYYLIVEANPVLYHGNTFSNPSSLVQFSFDVVVLATSLRCTLATPSPSRTVETPVTAAMERRPETELELGPQRGSHMVPSEGVPFSMTTCLRNLRRLRFPRPMFLYHSGTIDIWRPQAAQSPFCSWRTNNFQSNDWQFPVEDYPSGYPRFSALLAAHGSFHLGRRFSHLRARLLLLKQDRLSLLEKQLVEIDEKETTLLHLGCCRSDDNSNRRSVLSEIDCALADYGML